MSEQKILLAGELASYWLTDALRNDESRDDNFDALLASDRAWESRHRLFSLGCLLHYKPLPLQPPYLLPSFVQLIYCCFC